MEFSATEKERLEIFKKYREGRSRVRVDPWEDPEFQEEFARKDRYGFIHDTRLEKDVQEERVVKEEEEKLHKWRKIVGKSDAAVILRENDSKVRKNEAKSRNVWSAEFDSHRLFMRSERIRELIYRGIPEAVRGDVWQKLMGIAQLQVQQHGVYKQMRERAYRILDLQHVSQIDKDVNRCFRNHEFYKERYSPKQCSLFNVLTAYAVYNSELGYCQGLQCVAALLLMYMDEEEAFWALSQLLTHPKWLFHGFYTSSFPKMTRCTQFLEERMLRKLLPSVKKHFEQVGYLATLYAPAWFIQLFVCRVPFPIVVHFWDILLLEGDRALLWLAYAIMRARKKQLLAMSIEDLEVFFKQELPARFDLPRDTTLGEMMKDAKAQLEKLLATFKNDTPDWPHKPFGYLTAEQRRRDEYLLAHPTALSLSNFIQIDATSSTPSTKVDAVQPRAGSTVAKQPDRDSSLPPNGSVRVSKHTEQSSTSTAPAPARSSTTAPDDTSFALASGGAVTRRVLVNAQVESTSTSVVAAADSHTEPVQTRRGSLYDNESQAQARKAVPVSSEQPSNAALGQLTDARRPPSNSFEKPVQGERPTSQDRTNNAWRYGEATVRNSNQPDAMYQVYEDSRIGVDALTTRLTPGDNGLSSAAYRYAVPHTTKVVDPIRMRAETTVLTSDTVINTQLSPSKRTSQLSSNSKRTSSDDWHVNAQSAIGTVPADIGIRPADSNQVANLGNVENLLASRGRSESPERGSQYDNLHEITLRSTSNTPSTTRLSNANAIVNVNMNADSSISPSRPVTYRPNGPTSPTRNPNSTVFNTNQRSFACPYRRRDLRGTLKANGPAKRGNKTNKMLS